MVVPSGLLRPRRLLQDEFNARVCTVLVAVADLVTAVVMWARLLLLAEAARGAPGAAFPGATLPPRWQMYAFLAWLFLLQTPVPALLVCAADKERLRPAELWLRVSMMLPLLMTADFMLTVSVAVTDHHLSPAETVLVALLGTNLARAGLSRCVVHRYCRQLQSCPPSTALRFRLPRCHRSPAASAALRESVRARLAARRASAAAASASTASGTIGATLVATGPNYEGELRMNGHAHQPSADAICAPSPPPQQLPPVHQLPPGVLSPDIATECPPSYSTLFPHGAPLSLPPPPPPSPPPPPLSPPRPHRSPPPTPRTPPPQQPPT